MKKIGIFGGSFNPVHIEHINLAKAFLSELKLDELIVVPANIPPHKKNEEIISSQDRINMLKLTFGDIAGVTISTFEVDSLEVSYTYKTLEHFKKKYEDSRLYFLVGTDMLQDFITWKNPDRILELATLVLVRRLGDDELIAEQTYYNRFEKPFIKLSYVGKNISSTAIRASVALGLKVDGVPEIVLRYIFDNGFYRNAISEYVVKNLPVKRLTHTFGVIKLACKYAKKLKENASEAYYAAMLHDVAKYLDYKDFNLDIKSDVPKAVIHQFLGAYIAENVLKVENLNIINAIKYHTTGRKNMSRLEQIIFLADLLEEGRDFNGVEALRKLAEENFDLGFKQALIELYDHLSDSVEPVYYLTKECLDYYVSKRNVIDKK